MRKRTLQKMTTWRVVVNPWGEKTNVYLPMYGRGDFAQLRHAAADATHPHVQKSVLRWRAATDYVMQITAQPADANCSCRRAARHAPRHTRGCSASHARTVSHIRQFAEKYSSAALAAVPPRSTSMAQPGISSPLCLTNSMKSAGTLRHQPP